MWDTEYKEHNLSQLIVEHNIDNKVCGHTRDGHADCMCSLNPNIYNMLWTYWHIVKVDDGINDCVWF